MICACGTDGPRAFTSASCNDRVRCDNSRGPSVRPACRLLTTDADRSLGFSHKLLVSSYHIVRARCILQTPPRPLWTLLLSSLYEDDTTGNCMQYGDQQGSHKYVEYNINLHKIRWPLTGGQSPRPGKSVSHAWGDEKHIEWG